MILSAGKYHFYITYSSDALPDVQIGNWDSFSVAKSIVLTAGPLFGTGGKLKEIRGSFFIPKNLAHNNFEIRTFFLGHNNLMVKSISIIKD